jgi:hypothetical protein
VEGDDVTEALRDPPIRELGTPVILFPSSGGLQVNLNVILTSSTTNYKILQECMIS